MTSAFRSVNLKIGMSKYAGANCFSLWLLLLWQQDLGVSLMVEYPAESMPSLSGEDSGEFPSPSLVGNCFRGLLLGHDMGILKEGPTPSPVGPVHTMFGRALPTNCGMESNSLNNPCSTGQSCCSTLDLGCCLSDVAIACHHPSAKGRRIAMK